MKKILFMMAAACMLMLTACGAKVEDKAVDAQNVDTQISAAQEVYEAVLTPAQQNGYKIKDNALFPENLPMVVDFNATWCQPCKQFKPIFDAAAEKYAGQAIFLSVDIDQYPELAKRYNVNSVPSIAFIMPEGSVLGMEVGYMDAGKLDDFIKQLMASTAGEDFSL